MHARGGRAVALALLVALAALAVQCGGGGDDSDDGGSAAATTNGAAIAADLFDGKTVEEFFAVTCVACHGAGRQGLPGLGLPLTPETLIQDDQFYFDTIANGRPNTLMPPWKAAGVSDDEITALVTWLKSAQP